MDPCISSCEFNLHILFAQQTEFQTNFSLEKKRKNITETHLEIINIYWHLDGMLHLFTQQRRTWVDRNRTAAMEMSDMRVSTGRERHRRPTVTFSPAGNTKSRRRLPLTEHSSHGLSALCRNPETGRSCHPHRKPHCQVWDRGTEKGGGWWIKSRHNLFSKLSKLKTQICLW